MLVNYIKLEQGKPTRVHLTDAYWVDREIADRDRGGTKPVRSLVFQVDRLEGAPYFGTLSFISQKAQETFRPFLQGRRFLDYEFVVTMEGSGYSTEYRVQPVLITASRAVELANAPAPSVNPVENSGQTP